LDVADVLGERLYKLEVVKFNVRQVELEGPALVEVLGLLFKLLDAVARVALDLELVH
jgi:hypothetical protein